MPVHPLDKADDSLETSEEPVDGEIIETWFADFRTLIAEVRDEEGNIWEEVYKFDQATREVTE